MNEVPGMGIVDFDIVIENVPSSVTLTQDMFTVEGATGITALVNNGGGNYTLRTYMPSTGASAKAGTIVRVTKIEVDFTNECEIDFD